MREIRISDLRPKAVELPAVPRVISHGSPKGQPLPVAEAAEFESELTYIMNRLISSGAGNDVTAALLGAMSVVRANTLGAQERGL